MASQWTKNIDVHHHFIRDYIEDGALKIQFFHSKENMADPFTKNLSNSLFESLTQRYAQGDSDFKKSTLLFKSL